MKTALLAGLALAAALSSPACSVTTEPNPPRVGGYATVYADDVPPDIRTYPAAPYQGGYAYWHRDHWYYESPSGWVVLQQEPPELVRHRPYVQAAPPAPVVHQPAAPAAVAPPATQPLAPAPVQTAPPAVRVRLALSPRRTLMNVIVRPLCALTAALAIGALSAGCTGTVSAGPSATEGPSPTPVATTGRLTVRWTLNEGNDPGSCSLAGAATIRITPYNSVGQSVGEYAQDCTAFATTLDLPPGDYSGTALLANASGDARTTTINLNPFTIVAGSNLVIDVDFPASSFFQ